MYDSIDQIDSGPISPIVNPGYNQTEKKQNSANLLTSPTSEKNPKSQLDELPEYSVVTKKKISIEVTENDSYNKLVHQTDTPISSFHVELEDAYASIKKDSKSNDNGDMDISKSITLSIHDDSPPPPIIPMVTDTDLTDLEDKEKSGTNADQTGVAAGDEEPLYNNTVFAEVEGFQPNISDFSNLKESDVMEVFCHSSLPPDKETVVMGSGENLYMNV